MMIQDFFNISIKKRLNFLIKNNLSNTLINYFDYNYGGVYLLYCLDENNEVVFTYVGECANFKIRFKQHFYYLNNKNLRIYSNIRAKLKKAQCSLNQVMCVVLEHQDNANLRYKLETKYIYFLKDYLKKTLSTSVNKKNVSLKLKCYYNKGLIKICPKIYKNNFILEAKHIKKAICQCKFAIY